MYAARTRFIEASMLQHFAKATWPLASATIGDKPQPNKETINIGARLRGMWQ
jgi:DNA helicase-2/ATP-dependent DNA helicase PcrA